MTARGRPRSFSDDELVLTLVAVIRRVKRVPSVREFDRIVKRPRAGALITRFGSWSAAMERALELNEEIDGRAHSPQPAPCESGSSTALRREPAG